MILLRFKLGILFKLQALVIQGFANYLTGTQITLLVQGQEYTGESKKDIDGDVITSVRNELQKLNILYREYLLNQVPKIREDLKSCTQIKLYKDYLGVD